MKHENVFGIWISDKQELGVLQQLCINSYLAHGHNFTLFSYRDFSNTPDGCITRNLEPYFPEKLIFKDQHDSYATVADIIRYVLSYEIGGLYSDMDIVCMSDMIPCDEYYFVTETDNMKHVCNGCFKCPKHSDIMLTMLNYAYTPNKLSHLDYPSTRKDKLRTVAEHHGSHDLSMWRDIAFASLVFALKPAILQHGLLSYVHPNTDLFPVSWRESHKFLDGSLSLDMLNPSYWGVHVYNGTDSIHGASNINSGLIGELINKYMS